MHERDTALIRARIPLPQVGVAGSKFARSVTLMVVQGGLFCINYFCIRQREMHRYLSLIHIFILCAVASIARAQDDASNSEPSRERIRYDVSITGGTGDLRDKLREVSRLVSMRDRAPYSDIALERRAEADIERLNKLLESEGYYDGRANFRMDRTDERLKIEISVEPGPQYKIGNVALQIDTMATVPEGTAQKAITDLEELSGEPAKAAVVIATERQAVQYFHNSGFPKARRTSRDIQRNPADQTIGLDVTIAAGSFARFGAVTYQGTERIEPDFLNSFIPWASQEPVNQTLIEEFATNLRDSTLFSSVTITEPDDVSADGTYELIAEVREAPPRSISTGVSFSSDKGAGGTASWTHRNLFGRGERLGASLETNTLEQKANLQFTKPAFLRYNQTLDTNLEVRHTNFDAYEEDAISVDAALRRKLRNKWIFSVGAGAEIAKLTDITSQNTSYLLKAPFSATRSTVDDILDPKQGYQIGAEIVPYVGAFDGTTRFLRTELTGSTHYAIDDEYRWIISARARVGSIVGQSVAGIPQNQRLYAGGGGSVRGYEFQFVGPLGIDARPSGGRSVVETSLEIRTKISPTIGVVPFIDAGAVSESSLLLTDSRVRVGVGLGLRYYTGVGPFRLDFAVPVNRRKGVDAGFQFYLSFGQSF